MNHIRIEKGNRKLVLKRRQKICVVLQKTKKKEKDGRERRRH